MEGMPVGEIYKRPPSVCSTIEHGTRTRRRYSDSIAFTGLYELS